MLVTAATACSSPGPVAVSGDLLSPETFAFARLGHLDALTSGSDCAGAPCSGDDARARATLTGGGTLSVDELPAIAPATVSDDGRWAFPALPGDQRLHLIAGRPGACTTVDGIGLQFPESDVTNYPVGVLDEGGASLMGAVQAARPATASGGVIVLLLMDGSARFPDAGILDAQVAVRLERGSGAIAFAGWDPARAGGAGWVLAPTPDFAAPAFFTGFVVVSDVEDGAQIVITDLAPPSAASTANHRPGYYLRYTARPQAARCIFYWLRALG